MMQIKESENKISYRIYRLENIEKNCCTNENMDGTLSVRVRLIWSVFQKIKPRHIFLNKDEWLPIFSFIIFIHTQKLFALFSYSSARLRAAAYSGADRLPVGQSLTQFANIWLGSCMCFRTLHEFSLFQLPNAI